MPQSLFCEEYAPEPNLSEVCPRAYSVRRMQQSLICQKYARAYSVRRMQRSLTCEEYALYYHARAEAQAEHLRAGGAPDPLDPLPFVGMLGMCL